MPYISDPKNTTTYLTSETPEFGLSKYQFGKIVLTEKEMSTIRKMLEMKTLKEIAWLHGCSNTVEQNRIEIIKKKSGGEGMGRSTFFQFLKKHGILDACQQTYTTHP